MVTKCHIIFLTLKFFCQKFFASLYQFSLQPIMLCVSSGIYFVLFRPKPIVAYWVCKNKSVKKRYIFTWKILCSENSCHVECNYIYSLHGVWYRSLIISIFGNFISSTCFHSMFTEFLHDFTYPWTIVTQFYRRVEKM